MRAIKAVWPWLLRGVRVSVAFESLFALGGVAVSLLGVGVWLLANEIILVAILCAIPTVVGVIPLALRLRAGRQHRRQPTTFSEWTLRQLVASAQRQRETEQDDSR